jgi:hypothetical protein
MYKTWQYSLRYAGTVPANLVSQISNTAINLRGISRLGEDGESDGVQETVLVGVSDSSRMSRPSRLLWVAPRDTVLDTSSVL